MSPSTPRNASPDIGFAESSLGQSLLRMLAEGSASNRAIADYLLRNQVRVTALGIEELADACEVSTATISRFARDLGFRNYAAMKSAVAETLQSVLQPVEKLRSTIARRSASPALESLGYAEASITATSRALSGTELDRIGTMLTRARTVYVLGFGLSTFLAGTLAMHLQPFCRHVVEVAAAGGTEVAASQLATITDKDVLVVISLPRYTLAAVSLTRFARDSGATVVSITDSPASPLAELGHQVLYAHGTHPVLPSSASAALAIIEALAVSLMTSNKANVAKAARHTEAIAAYLYGEHQIRSSSTQKKEGASRRRNVKQS
ncbi:MurR/RpiR family transcriptional regulator [Massilia sp. IC2-476]|uniref:MurR/RpiR family transcriptional regulator n=1 Tax=Massilia sp. IC2-476 TaxID=2887199 RepID=UPI001D13003B|nr:MurR/RpiR family transcriptional regulator [Massilia sp. IC2-476]MCC2972730.1 MurR/RpiR family transcriptional regulator [Massilia sp. IC2-476]